MESLGGPLVMRFLAKDLGLISYSTQLEIADSMYKKASVTAQSSGTQNPGMGMTKFKCAAPSCDTIGATHRCSDCHISQCCSSECQLMDWKKGGHKKICRELRKEIWMSLPLGLVVSLRKRLPLAFLTEWLKAWLPEA